MNDIKTYIVCVDGENIGEFRTDCKEGLHRNARLFWPTSLIQITEKQND